MNINESIKIKELTEKVELLQTRINYLTAKLNNNVNLEDFDFAEEQIIEGAKKYIYWKFHDGGNVLNIDTLISCCRESIWSFHQYASYNRLGNNMKNWVDDMYFEKIKNKADEEIDNLIKSMECNMNEEE